MLENTPISHLSVFLLGCLALLIGPALGVSGRSGPRVSAAHEGFSMSLVFVLCGFIVLPHVLHELGYVGAFCVLLGVLVPILMRKIALHMPWSTGIVWLLIAVHAAIDGAIIGIGLDHGSEALPWAVIAHRIPFGFALFAWAIKVAPSRQHGHRLAWWSVLGLMLVTGLGFVSAGSVMHVLPPALPGVMEALVAGLLIAMVFGLQSQPLRITHGAVLSYPRWTGVGTLLGLSVALSLAAASWVM